MSFFDPTGTLISSQSRFLVDGVLGGAQIGYNWQVANWVWGLETDFQGTGQRGTGNYVCPTTACRAGPFTDSLTQRLDWFEHDARSGRSGAGAGFALVRHRRCCLRRYSDQRNYRGGTPAQPPSSLGFNTEKVGWTAGAGYEGHPGGNWTWKIEYLFIDFGNVTGNGVTPNISSGTGFCDTHVCNLGTSFNSTFTDNILRVGLNYKWQ